MTITIAIAVFLFALICSTKAITSQRAKHARQLASLDARLEFYSIQTAKLAAMLEQDKKDGLI